ncbi:hypothetical protein D3C80_1942490 [compost metagenome]
MDAFQKINEPTDGKIPIYRMPMVASLLSGKGIPEVKTNGNIKIKASIADTAVDAIGGKPFILRPRME